MPLDTYGDATYGLGLYGFGGGVTVPTFPTTADFADAIRRSHTVAVRATLLDAGVETELEAVIDGTVTLDGRAATRGRCDLVVGVSFDALDLVPDTPASALAPYGNEIRVERGIEYSDGTLELVSLGIFRIDDTEVVDKPDDLQIRIVGLDRSARIIDARFEEPYQITAGTEIDTAILDTIQAVWPDVEYEFTSTSLTVPQTIAEEGDDRWALCQTIATAGGFELYFDGDGLLILSPAPSGAAVDELVEGEDGLLVEAGRRWTREGTFNRVIATGENTDLAAAVRGVATDENPLSPTYYYGPFGRVPRFYSSPFLTTDAQCTDAAQAILSKELGTTQQVQFGSIVNPALKPGHVVRITRARAGIDEDHILDTVTIPLSATGAMSGQTRAQVVG